MKGRWLAGRFLIEDDGGCFCLLFLILATAGITVAISPDSTAGSVGLFFFLLIVGLWLVFPVGIEWGPGARSSGAPLNTSADPLIGRTGNVVSDLLPEGKIRVGDDVLDARTKGYRLKVGQWVKIVGREGPELIVEPTKTKPTDEPESLPQGLPDGASAAAQVPVADARLRMGRIVLRCPGCKNRGNVPRSRAGMTGKCKRCGALLKLPDRVC